jgi:acyl-coenzyme A synthetase/AMP-(fatty) acid ligase
MKMPPPDLRARLKHGGAGVLRARDAVLEFGALVTGSPLSVAQDSLDGAHVLLRTRSQIAAALALIALDGIAGRIVIAPPDLADDHLRDVIRRAGIDTLATDGDAIDGLRLVAISGDLGLAPRETATRASEWVMFTSGTTGAPRMVAHTLEALTGAIRAANEPATWGTFYDIRRYGGLQIFLRAVLGDASLILSDADESIGDFLGRLARDSVTHLTGTPSHWRRALMCPAIGRITPRYLRLSGEIADQAVLDSLKARFPAATIVHAYASTEVGVGFEVTDGLEGFPASFVGGLGPVEMRIADGSLQFRSPRAASRYIQDHDERDERARESDRFKEGGFVDTGDMVELRDNRYYFVGRRGGIINVGGLKLHPEEVEAVINRHPAVYLSRVFGRRNPITGAIVIAEVVLENGGDRDTIQKEILRACRASLKPFQVPAMVRVVANLELSAGGKLRRDA